LAYIENSSRLYNTIAKILCQHENWLDIRHLYTLAWMMVGLILSEGAKTLMIYGLKISRILGIGE
jgi:hypothetical protein